MSYEHFEHTADVGIRGIGETLEESFEMAGKALFAVMINLDNVEITDELSIEVEGENSEDLLYNWLSELIFLMNVEEKVFSDFSVKIEGNQLRGRVRGEVINYNKHELLTEVKAITYSQILVEQKENSWIAQCIVDV